MNYNIVIKYIAILKYKLVLLVGIWVEWNNHISILDAFIKSIDKYKKILITCAVIFTVIPFIFKMGFLWKIPNFLGNIANTIAIPSNNNIDPLSTEDLKENLSELLELPTTPLGIILALGGIVISFSTFRFAFKSYKLLKKIIKHV